MQLVYGPGTDVRYCQLNYIKYKIEFCMARLAIPKNIKKYQKMISCLALIPIAGS